MSRFRDEIAEQPRVLSRMLERGRDLEAIGSRIREMGPRGFVIAARGSSDHAALYAKYLFGTRNHSLVALAAPSLFTHYSRPPILAGQCVIGISQSGASPDVIAVVEEGRRQGSLTLAITNDASSRLATAAELVLSLEAGPEQMALQSESSARMNGLLSVLPDKQREILILRVVVGMSAEETAEAVGSTPGAVRVAQHRALARLKAEITATERGHA